MCELSLSNCHVCDNHVNKRPVIKNKACDICRQTKYGVTRHVRVQSPAIYDQACYDF